MGPEPVRIGMTVPEGIVIRGTSPGVIIQGNIASLETTLAEDLTFEVRYGPA